MIAHWYDYWRERPCIYLNMAGYPVKDISKKALTERLFNEGYVYPIPDSQMKVKKGLYEQNKEYN